MGVLELNSYGLASLSVSSTLKNIHAPRTACSVQLRGPKHLRSSRGKIKAAGTIPESDQSETTTSQEPPQVNFAFVRSVLLPDGNMDIQCRTATGGQKLRDIMLDANVDLYGPYARPLLNCGGGGICATCIVEVVQGKELLGPRTEIEREKLKKHPKNWRLACQTTVGKPDSRGLVIIQQLPEWKAHDWNYGEPPPLEEDEEAEKE